MTKPATCKPITYCISYGGHAGFANNPDDLVADVTAGPPHLMHIAHDVPFPNTYGPIELVEDGNTTRLIGPKENRKRVKDIKRLLRRLRKAGCRTVIPYICNQTLAGDPEKRLGIWEFYDHWDEYAGFGIGPRPEKDPIDWLARGPDGTLHFNYEKRLPMFTQFGLARWAPCCNNPSYHQWQRMVVSQLARVGYDGVFVDNCILNCYCEHCQAKFRKYLAARYTPAELARRFGANKVAELSLGVAGNRLEWVRADPAFKEFLREHFDDGELVTWCGNADLDKAPIEEAGNGWLWARAHDFRRWLEQRYSAEELERRFGVRGLSEWGIKTPEDRVLWAETKRFWAQSVCDNLAFIRETGEAERDGFVVTPNWGNMEELDATEFREEIGHTVDLWRPGMDFMMFEEGNAAGAVAPGLYVDHILQYKFCFALGAKAAVLPYGNLHDGAVELGNAENAAGGGYAFIQPGTKFPEPRAKWTSFLEEHGAMLEGGRSVAEVAVLYLSDELLLENSRHLRWIYLVTRYLADQRILFDLVTEDQLRPNGLDDYHALIVPTARYLADAQISTVLEFDARGGAVVLIGDSATHDETARRRSTPGFAALSDGAKTVAPGLRLSDDGRRIVADSPDPLIGPCRVTREDGFQFATYSQGSVNVPFGSAGLVSELDRMIGIDRYTEPRELAPRLEAALGHPLRLADAPAAMGVRFSAYRRDSEEGPTLLLHVVNYNVPVVPHPRGKTVEPIEDLCITLPISPSWDIATATLLEPGRGPETVPLDTKADTLTFTIPHLDVYKLVVLGPGGDLS